MVEKPSHVKQLSLNHVCKIGLKIVDNCDCIPEADGTAPGQSGPAGSRRVGPADRPRWHGTRTGPAGGPWWTRAPLGRPALGYSA
jgi:hypothetical protein